MKARARALVKGFVTLLGLAAIVGVLAWLMGAFHEKTPPGETRARERALPEGAKTVAVQSVQVPLTESAVGTVHPVHRVSVGSKLLARVVTMNVKKAGATVHANDVLAELDDADLKARQAEAQAALTSAQAQRGQAEVEVERMRRLYEQRVEPKAALDTAETALKTADAAVASATQGLEVARARLDWAKVRAPIDGIVIDKHAEEGDLVSPGQVLVTLYDPDRMQLVARVRERLAASLKPGAHVEVSIEALGHTCTGVIDQVVPEAEAGSRVFEVRVSGPCPDDAFAGMFGRLHVPVGTHQELRIPDGAVRRVGQMETVYVVKDGRTIQRRFVQTGRATGDQVEVLAGLAAGETIVAHAGDVQP